MQKEFEIGPIRPPSEAESLLLRITRNCPWNKCKFCRIYKRKQFKTRSIEEIKQDIDIVAAYRDDVLQLFPEGKSFDSYTLQHRLRTRLADMPDANAQQYLYVANWVLSGERSVFLQDANTMVLTHDKLKEILVYLKEKLPRIQRITSYGRVDSLDKFSVSQLESLRSAGLDRIHSGYETGSDKVLELINKGYTKAQEISAGQKVKASGIELSIYVMPGVGGRELSHDNAVETADVINQVNPDFVRIRTFVSQYGTGLFEEIEAGRLVECTDKGKLMELKKMIEHIDGVDGHLFSDHIINLLEGIKGNMGTDKEYMLSLIKEFEDLPARQQKEYQLARRMAMVRTPKDMELLSWQQLSKIRSTLDGFRSDEEFEEFMLKYLRRYV
ncbi:MAG: radical SAM protein [Anaerovoracaceae bacterium]|jgi:biotin synthase-like enzyme